MPTAVCMDCAIHQNNPKPADDASAFEKTFWEEHHLPSPLPSDFICAHFQPDYWEKKGYRRHWGDAAIGNWPYIEILRGEFDEQRRKVVKFVILMPFFTRRPIEIDAPVGTGVIPNEIWGSY